MILPYLKKISRIIRGLSGSDDESYLIINGDRHSGEYKIINKTIFSSYRTKYELIKGTVIYILTIEDYRDADFMVDKFYVACIFKKNGRLMVSIEPKNVII